MIDVEPVNPPPGPAVDAFGEPASPLTAPRCECDRPAVDVDQDGRWACVLCGKAAKQ